MQRFMVLIKGGRPDSNVLSPAEMEAHMGKWYAWTQQLIEQGHYLAGDALMRTGATLEGEPGNLRVTEGPFPESQEVVGGYFVLRAHDLAQAIEICHRSPNYEFGGSVEIRPFLEFIPEDAKAYETSL